MARMHGIPHLLGCLCCCCCAFASWLLLGRTCLVLPAACLFDSGACCLIDEELMVTCSPAPQHEHSAGLPGHRLWCLSLGMPLAALHGFLPVQHPASLCHDPRTLACCCLPDLVCAVTACVALVWLLLTEALSGWSGCCAGTPSPCTADLMLATCSL